MIGRPTVPHLLLAAAAAATGYVVRVISRAR